MSGDPDRPRDDALTGFVWTVYDDTDAIVHMRHALFDPPEEASGDDTRTSLAAFAGWLADAWPTVLGTRDDVIWAVMALPSDQLVAAGLTGVELGMPHVDDGVRVVVNRPHETGQLVIPGPIWVTRHASPHKEVPAVPAVGRLSDGRTTRSTKWRENASESSCNLQCQHIR